MEDSSVPKVNADPPQSDVDPIARRELVTRLMRRQAALSIRVAAVFIALLIALPLFNLYAPALAHKEVLGFSLTWLILGMLFFPITWALSGYFVHASDKVEARLVAENATNPIREPGA